MGASNQINTSNNKNHTNASKIPTIWARIHIKEEGKPPKSGAIAPSAQEPNQETNRNGDREFSGKSEIRLGYLQLGSFDRSIGEFIRNNIHISRRFTKRRIGPFVREISAFAFAAAGFSRVVLLLTSASWCACLGIGFFSRHLSHGLNRFPTGHGVRIFSPQVVLNIFIYSNQYFQQSS